jgi:hypothetical protein
MFEDPISGEQAVDRRFARRGEGRVEAEVPEMDPRLLPSTQGEGFGKGTLPAPQESPTLDGRVPDPLIPMRDPYTGNLLGAPFTVAAGTNQPVWVDVRIPVDQAYGTYTGSISFSGTSIKVPLAVTVWDITLPDMRSVTAWFQIAYGAIGRYHAGVAACWDTSCDAAHREIVKRYEELVHEHRVDPLQTLVRNPGGCSAPAAGDWAQFDADLAPYMDGSYFDDQVPSSIYMAPFTPHGSGWGPTSCSQADVTAAAKAWAQHLKAKGWFYSTYVFAEDEPGDADLPAIAKQCGWLDQADPDWRARIFDTVAATTETTALLDPYMGIYVVCLKCYDDWVYQPGYGGGDVLGRAEWPARIEQGWRFWLYESNAQGAPYPGFATNTLDAAEPRMLMWASWFERASGFLYWSVSSWDDADPWGPNIMYGKTGDGVLIYPGDHSGTSIGKGSPPGISVQGPIPSIRLKMVRSGLQDWSLFLLAERNGLRNQVMSELANVYDRMGGCSWSGCPGPPNKSWYWRTDYALMSTARRNAVNAMLASQ